MTMTKPMFTFWGVLFLCFSTGNAQTDLEVDPNDLYPGGNTVSIGNNCFRLTTARDWQSGTIWYDQAISLQEPFEMEMELFFGCQDAEGADGMVFIFLPDKVPTGYKGEGMGFGGLYPSLGIEIDTWQNYHLFDPAGDHVALMAHGNVSHEASLAGPVEIPDVEDCRPHNFRINWEPDAQLLTAFLDGRPVINYRLDVINRIFGGKDRLYWGVSAATGKYHNRQEICFKQLTFNQPELGYSVKRKLLEGDIVNMERVQFARGRTQPGGEAVAELDKLVRFLQANPGLSVELYTHSKESGDGRRDDALSEKRAEAVQTYLVQQGIDPKRIHQRALGQRFADDLKSGNRFAVHVFRPVP